MIEGYDGRRILRIRRWTLLSLLAITPAGFWLKFYGGPGRGWVNNYAAGVLYEIFWCLVLVFFWPRREYLGRIAVAVLFGTIVLEVLQLWHLWFLERIRGGFLGRALIGTAFSWWDFPHYVLGCALGWLWMGRIVGRSGERRRGSNDGAHKG